MDHKSMEKLRKRYKTMKEPPIEDIATTISDIAETMDSINDSFRSLLKVNLTVVLYCLNVERRAKELNMGDVVTNLASRSDSSEESTDKS